MFLRQVVSPLNRKGKPLESTDFECTLDQIQTTKYVEVAIESYPTLCELRDQGIISQGIRRQVSVSTPINTTWCHVEYVYRERIDPLYMERLIQDLLHLQDTIPAHDVAVQIDAAIEYAYLKYERGRI